MKLTFRSKKTKDYIFDHLTDMQKFAAIHPVISKIENIKDDKYLVYETLKFSFIPFSFTYPVQVQKNKNKKTVTFQAKVFKIINIEMLFHLKSEGDFTIITENINFKTLLPIKFVLKKVFKAQHILLFKNIESHNSKGTIDGL